MNLQLDLQKKAVIFRLLAFDPVMAGYLFESPSSTHLRAQDVPKSIEDQTGVLMMSNRWNRRKTKKTDEEISAEKRGEYRISRIRPKKRRSKHPGYTIIPHERHWIFENPPKFTT